VRTRASRSPRPGCMPPCAALLGARIRPGTKAGHYIPGPPAPCVLTGVCREGVRG